MVENVLSNLQTRRQLFWACPGQWQVNSLFNRHQPVKIMKTQTLKTLKQILLVLLATISPLLLASASSVTPTRPARRHGSTAR